jgi:hypothetical protein
LDYYWGISSVSGTAPISVSTVSGAATVSIATANTTTTGALTSTDWNTFNGKQGTITLTTTGTSGAATFTSNTLNIPNYGSALTGYVPYTGATTNLNLGTNDLYARILWATNAQTYYLNASTDVNGGYVQTYRTSDNTYHPIFIYGATDSVTASELKLDSNGVSITTMNSDMGLSVYNPQATDGGSTPVFMSHKNTAGSIKTASIEVTGIGEINIRTGATALRSYGTTALKFTVGGAAIFNSTITASGNLNLQGAVTRNINFYDSSNTNINAQIQYDQLSSNSGQLFFGTNNAGTFATRLTIGSTGLATFSGAISATSGSFNGNVRAVSLYNIYKSDNATLGAQLSYDGVVNQFYLWNNISNGYFSIYTNSAERFQIASTGSASFFSVGSIFNANNGTLSADILTIRGGGGTGAFGFKVEANNGEDIFYTDNYTYNVFSNTVGGNTLIGTTSGVSGGGKLQVNGDVNINGNFKINGTIIGGGGGSGVTGSGTTNYVPKWTSASALGNSIMYDTGSCISINRTNPTLGGFDPTFLVRQKGDGDWNGFQIEPNANDAVLNIGYRSGSDSFVLNTSYRVSSNYKPIDIIPQASMTRFFLNGNVSIGSATDTGARLNVIGTNVYMNIANSNDTRYVNLGLWVAGRAQFEVGNGDLFIKTQTNNFLALGTNTVIRLYITGGGNVLIGSTTDSGYKLQVTGAIYATADITAFSDISVKENIRPIQNVLTKINNSRGVLYDRIDTKTKNNIGFIAQELEKEFPELISTNNDGTKGVKYQNAVAVLFEAIKEQQKQINELKNIN